MRTSVSVVPVALLLVLSSQTAFAQGARRVAPAGIPVRYAEGSVHGFLELRTAAGQLLASGDLTQAPRDRGIESRMTFHFPDSSRFEESATFTQRGVFALQSYHLVQRGKAFAEDLDASLTGAGHYVVRTRSHKDGKEERHEGTLEMPPDVSNGLVINLLKNLNRHDTQTVHVVAFTPKPRMVKLELIPVAERRVLNGQRGETAVEFVLHPHIDGVTGFFARLLGKMPPDSRAWIVTQDAPAFVRFEGPLYSGPVWRIDLVAPHWPR